MTAADKPRRDLGADCSCATFGGYDSLCVIHGPNGTQAREQAARVSDKPRADLVALFDAFAASAPAYSSLQLHGDAAAEALLDWGHGARSERRERADGSAVLVACLDLPNRSWIVAHFDRAPAQADQQVIARVQAALDGEQPDPERNADGNPFVGPAELVGHRRSPADVAATVIGSVLDEPAAAEGSV